MTPSPDKLKEDRVRKLARKHGYTLRKFRQRKFVPNSIDHGLYQLTDDKDQIVVGARYDASLDHIERCLKHVSESDGLYYEPWPQS